MEKPKKDYLVYGEVLSRASIGSWKIEVEEEKPPRMWADTTMMRLLGVSDRTLTPEEMYHAWYDHIDKDHYAAVAEGVERMTKGQHAEIQYPWHHPDGSTIIVRCGGVRDFDFEEGVRIAGIHQWVTELHHVEYRRAKSSRASDATLSSIVKQLYGYNLTVDLTDGSFTTITGTGMAELIGIANSSKDYRAFFDRCLARTRPEFQDAYRAMLALDFMRNHCEHLGYYDTLEYAVASDRGDVWEEVNITFGLNDDGHPVANLLGRDVSDSRRDQVRREREIKAAAARDQVLSSITQSLYGFNVTVNLDTGTYSLITGTGAEEICQILGAYKDYTLAVGALLARVADDCKADARRLIGRDYLLSHRNHDGHVGSGEFAWKTREGGVNWLELNVFIGSDKEGDPLANILGRDVTERHTRAETQRQLLLAKQTSDAKTKFLSTMSHDIRTPMNSILGMTTIAQTCIRRRKENGLSDAECLEKISHCLDSVLAATHHMSGLVNDILDMSRIDSGRLVLGEKPFSIDEMKAYVSAVIRPQADEKGLVLRCEERDVAHRRLVGDMMRLGQILINIFGNSVKFTDAGGTVGWTIDERPGRTGGEVTLAFTCSDTGRGMSEEFLPHLFEPFSQENRRYGDTFVGTGLGMPIVKQLVELMRGTIEVQSELGKGTTFVISIPLRIDRGAAPGAAVASASHADGLKLISKYRFLVVEDVPANAEVLTQMLALAGGRCDVATNGAEGVERFKSAEPGTYDCILMDVRMPVMNGYEATEAIRALPHPDARKIPIIAMTADAFTDDVERAFASGMDAHVSKPIRFKLFPATLADAVARRARLSRE